MDAHESSSGFDHLGQPPLRGGRARRGDVRAAVLALLTERPMHGYEIIQELESRTDGVWKPSPGSVYPTLALLEDQGLIKNNSAGGKKQFELTPAGLQARGPAGNTPWADMLRKADPSRIAMREAVHTMTIAARQVAEVGNDQQKSQAVQLINELRKSLYLLLAT